MDKEIMRQLLPEKPPEGMLRWVRTQCQDDIADEYTIFVNERGRQAPEMWELMDNRTKGKSTWMTYCTCTACNESYYTQKVKGFRAFVMAEGEDGAFYTAPEGECLDGVNYIPVAEGDEMNCPFCGNKTKVIHASSLRGGRTKQIQVATLHNISGHAVIVYWLAKKEIHSYGAFMDATPRYAYALTESGGLVAYTHRAPGVYGKDVKASKWRAMVTNGERWYNRYSDWGSTNNTKAGTVIYPVADSLDGTTGEKTGLQKYWQAGIRKPVEYLKLWKSWKPVENLVVAGYTHLVSAAVSCDYYDPAYAPKVELGKYMNLKEKRPHKILGISKQDFKEISQWDRKPGVEDFKLWRRYRELGGMLGGYDFLAMCKKLGRNVMSTVMDLLEQDKHCDIQRLERYMEKQWLSLGETRLLIDTRNMARKLYGRELTQEELWPRHLMQVHDRLAEMLAEKEKQAKGMKYQEGFDKVLERFGAIQWTDKELAVILPKSNGDLIREGSVLRHCVGGYGMDHAEGVDIILFVRHYRRPERPYYTLNISFKGSEPKEVQLHGYGNERHGPYKQYSHKIPKKVRDFVDRWEREIMLPWWREQQKKEKTA